MATRLRHLPHLLFLTFALAGCIARAPEQATTSLRVPQPSAPPVFEQTGKASWYGPGLHGKTTASGETFDQNQMTAAHRTLPLGTEARVTNLENGKTVDVTVNDRGPFVRGRVIDLSAKAAKQLDLKKDGVGRVKIEVKADDAPLEETASK